MDMDKAVTPATPGVHASSGLPLAENNVIQTSDEQEDEKNDLEGVNRDTMGHSVLDNMEINMVHILPSEFQLTISQPNFVGTIWLPKKLLK